MREQELLDYRVWAERAKNKRQRLEELDTIIGSPPSANIGMPKGGNGEPRTVILADRRYKIEQELEFALNRMEEAEAKISLVESMIAEPFGIVVCREFYVLGLSEIEIAHKHKCSRSTVRLRRLKIRNVLRSLPET